MFLTRDKGSGFLSIGGIDRCALDSESVHDRHIGGLWSEGGELSHLLHMQLLKVHPKPRKNHLTTHNTMRTSPNIIITGTPGVGKTTHCEQLASSTGLTHLNVNKVVKERNCEDGFDEELNSVIVDEDKVSRGKFCKVSLCKVDLIHGWAAPRCN